MCNNHHYQISFGKAWQAYLIVDATQEPSWHRHASCRFQVRQWGKEECRVWGDNPFALTNNTSPSASGPSFCWQGPQCRSIFDLTSTANQRDGAECQREVSLFAYWASNGGRNVWKESERRKLNALGYCVYQNTNKNKEKKLVQKEWC